MTARPQLTIRPTELGVKGLLLFAALQLAFRATSYNSLFFLLLVFGAALAGVGLWWTVRNLRGVRLGKVWIPAGPADRPRPIDLTLHLGERLRGDIAVELAVDGRHVEVAHVALANGDASLHGELPPQPRGVLAVPHLRLKSRYPFGLALIRLDVPLTAELVTWPAPAREAATRRRLRGHGTAAANDGASAAAAFSHLRPFASGDAVRDVHWARTARLGRPIVRQRERAADRSTEIPIDRRIAPEAFERQLGEATGRLLALAPGERLALVGEELSIHAIGEPHGAEAALRWLAGATPLPADGPPPGGSRSGPAEVLAP